MRRFEVIYARGRSGARMKKELIQLAHQIEIPLYLWVDRGIVKHFYFLSPLDIEKSAYLSSTLYGYAGLKKLLLRTEVLPLDVFLDNTDVSVLYEP